MAGWDLVKIEDTCEILDRLRKPITKKDRVTGPYPYYGATGVLDHVEGFLFDEPLVLVGEDGAKWESGESTSFPIRGKCWVNNHAHVLRPNPNILVDSWLIYYLNYSDLTPFITGLTVPKLNQSQLRKITFPLPPLAEQERIVAILDEAFAAIETATANAEKNIENARELFESQLERAFSSKDSGDVVVEGWKQKRLGDICVVDWGNTKLTKKSFVEDGPYLGVSAAGCDGRMGHAEHTKYTPVLSAIGARCGRMFFPDEDFTAIKNTITLTPLEGVCTGVFLFNLLTSVDLPKRGAAQPFISKGDIQDFIVTLPPLCEQERIVAFLDEASMHSKQLEQISTDKLEHLSNLRQSLLQKAFSGELIADNMAADQKLSEAGV